jgi:hypothetical protein
LFARAHEQRVDDRRCLSLLMLRFPWRLIIMR